MRSRSALVRPVDKIIEQHPWRRIRSSAHAQQLLFECHAGARRRQYEGHEIVPVVSNEAGLREYPVFATNSVDHHQGHADRLATLPHATRLMGRSTAERRCH